MLPGPRWLKKKFFFFSPWGSRRALNFYRKKWKTDENTTAFLVIEQARVCRFSQPVSLRRLPQLVEKKVKKKFLRIYHWSVYFDRIQGFSGEAMKPIQNVEE